MPAKGLFIGCFLMVSMACSSQGVRSQEAGSTTGTEAVAPLDTQQLGATLGVRGTEQDGQYKVAVPQQGLNVSVDGFRIVPAMGLTSWAAFAPSPQGAIVMGDLVVQEDEIATVERTLLGSGLTVSALHNHFVRENPKVMFMHIHGVGPQQQLASGVRSTLDKISQLRQEKGLASEPSSVESSFDPTVIDSLLGHSGSMNSGVYKVTIGRPDVQLTDSGSEVTSFLGFNTWMAFQGTSDRAAVCGDFTMLEQEVAPVIQALVQNGLEVVAVHNHMVTEKPRIFFLHFWGVGPIEALARGLRAGLDQTGTD